MKVTKKELFYNSISDRWPEKINNNETKKRMNVVFKKLLVETDFKGKKFLEVGCGLGYFSQRATKMGAKVTGIDVGDRLVAICKRKIKKGRFVIASAQDLPFPDNTFDIVLCTEVIEHVETPIKALSEIRRVVRKGGIVVITTPNRVFKPLFDLLSFLRLRPYHGNENWYFTGSLKKVLTRNGFTLLKEYYFNFFYPISFLNYFEKFYYLRNLMINQGYLLLK